MATSSTATDVVGLSDADRAAIGGVPQRIVEAWAAQDADAFADVFTEDGTMILPGVLCQGQEEIRQFMREAFAGPYRGTRVTGAPIGMRAIDAAAALVVTRGGVIAPGETTVASGNDVRATWVVVKQGGTWRLTAYQNSPAVGADA